MLAKHAKSGSVERGYEVREKFPPSFTPFWCPRTRKSNTSISTQRVLSFRSRILHWWKLWIGRRQWPNTWSKSQVYGGWSHWRRSCNSGRDRKADGGRKRIAQGYWLVRRWRRAGRRCCGWKARLHVNRVLPHLERLPCPRWLSHVLDEPQLVLPA